MGGLINAEFIGRAAKVSPTGRDYLRIMFFLELMMASPFRGGFTQKKRLFP